MLHRNEGLDIKLDEWIRVNHGSEAESNGETANTIVVRRSLIRISPKSIYRGIQGDFYSGSQQRSENSIPKIVCRLQDMETRSLDMAGRQLERINSKCDK